MSWDSQVIIAEPQLAQIGTLLGALLLMALFSELVDGINLWTVVKWWLIIGVPLGIFSLLIGWAR